MAAARGTTPAGEAGVAGASSPRPVAAAARGRADRVGAVLSGTAHGAAVGAGSVVAQTVEQPGFLGEVAAFFGLPGAPATTAPTVASVPLLARLTLDDLLGGSAPPPTADPATVITGLFRQVLRQDPTETELRNYAGVWNLTGINGVVAGLYSSTAFRQTQVNNYYLELLGRPATQAELSWGATQLTWGVPEPVLSASIAGGREFYAASSAGSGPDGAVPSAVSFVQLLYRTLVGDLPDVTAPVYVQQVQSGIPTGLVSLQFVTADPFRQVKVLETFEVLGLSPTPAVIEGYVDNWFWSGGLAGIATQLLASGENVFRIEAGLVDLPDLVAAAQMQQLLLAPYDEQPTGFVGLFTTLFGNPTADNNCRKTPDTCANPGLYAMLSGGGVDRGIPNNAIAVREIAAPVSALIPTQDEISLRSSLGFPLKNADTLRLYFEGGTVKVARNFIGTAGDGQYVLDGHHRWSQLYLINPFANIEAADIGYVPNPKEGLRETQIGIAAQIGYFVPEPSSDDNLFTISRSDFDVQVAAIIDDQSLFEKTRVIEVFTEYLALEGQTDEEKIVSIQNYLWRNVERMRRDNFYVTDATGRPFMPQIPRAELQNVLGLMAGPSSLSFSFPVISYLG